MNTYGTRLGIIKQVLGLGYKDLLERLDNCVTERSLRNYIDNKTQITGDIITMVAKVFPEINPMWWHTGEGTVLKENSYRNETKTPIAAEPLPEYKLPGDDENISIPASELFHAFFKDMSEVNRLLQSRLEYYEVFIRNIKKFKV
jgi:hypothetical protein